MTIASLGGRHPDPGRFPFRKGDRVLLLAHETPRPGTGARLIALPDWVCVDPPAPLLRRWPPCHTSTLLGAGIAAPDLRVGEVVVWVCSRPAWTASAAVRAGGPPPSQCIPWPASWLCAVPGPPT